MRDVVNSNSDLCSASVLEVLYVILCCIGLHYNGIRLYVNVCFLSGSSCCLAVTLYQGDLISVEFCIHIYIAEKMP